MGVSVRLWILLSFLCLAACSQQTMIDKLASRNEQALAINVAQQLRAGRADLIVAEAQPQLASEISRVTPQIRSMLEPVKGPFAIKTANVFKMLNGPTTKTFVLQAGSGSRWALVEVVLQGIPQQMELSGFHVQPFAADPSQANRFHWGDQGLVGYIWLALMLACVLTCLWAVFLIWRRPWLKRRWLWTLGSLFGFAGFGLNWATGAWAILFVNVSLLGARATKMGPYSPWILSFGIPIVAVIVMVRWYRREVTKS